MALSSPEVRRPTDDAPTIRSSRRSPLIAQVLAELQRMNEPTLDRFSGQLADLDAADPAWLELIRAEIELLLDRGHDPRLADYQRRFPHWADWLEALFDELEASERLHPPTKRLPSAVANQETRRDRNTRKNSFPKVPGYEVLEVIGRGGMGIVYKARQLGLNRLVAIKMILSDSQPTHEDLLRFRLEAEAVAAIKHPNIVQIFDIGEHEGLPYFSLEYVPGGTLSQFCAGKPQSPTVAAEIVAILAEAVHMAHLQNIVHRDLKPGNVLMAQGDSQLSPLKVVPKITDFGLAKRLDSGRDLTSTGVAAGTPVYMAPEQVSGKRGGISPASDVWALGVILYEMMTGRPPFQADNPIAVMSMVASSSPMLPRQVQSKVPIDLETICLKCLEKSPALRYGSAAELASDLRRYLDGRPILARRASPWEQCWRWSRRNPVIAGLIASIATLLVAGTAVSTMLAIESRRHAQDAEQKKLMADDNAEMALQNERRAVESARETARALQETERQRNEANKLRTESNDRELRRTRELYAADATIAHESWRRGRQRLAAKFLADYTPGLNSDVDLRGFEWYYIDRISRSNVRVVQLADDYDGLEASRDGQNVYLKGRHNITFVFDRGFQSSFLTTMTIAPNAMALRPDGKVLATADVDGKVRLWSTETSKLVDTLPLHQSPALGVAWSADGKRLASSSCDGSKPGRVVAIDVDTRAEVYRSDQEFWVDRLSFSPDGQQLVYSSPSMVYAADLTRRTPTCGFGPGAQVILAMEHCPWSGMVALGMANGRILVVDPMRLRVEKTLYGHEGPVTAIAFDAERKLLASGGADGSVRLWNVETESLLDVFRGHDGTVRGVKFRGKTGEVISTGVDSTCRYWRPAVSSDHRTLLKLPDLRSGQLLSVVPAHDGKRLLIRIGYDNLEWLDVASGQRALVTMEPTDLIRCMDIELTADDQAVIVNDLDRGMEVKSLVPGKQPPSLGHVKHAAGHRLRASSDGRWLVTSPRPNLLHLNRLDRPGEPVTFELQGHVDALAVSPGDDPLVAAVTCDGQFYLWNGANGQRVAHQPNLPERVVSLEISPRRDMIVGGGVRSRILFWDARTGQQQMTLPIQNGASFVRFEPSGNRIAVACEDRSIKLIDPQTGRQTLALDGHTRHGMLALFTPTGDGLISVDNKNILYWDAAPAYEREQVRRVVESLQVVNPRLVGEPKAGEQIVIGFDIVNRSRTDLPSPPTDKPINNLYIDVLVEPVNQLPPLPLPTLGQSYAIGEMRCLINRSIKGGEIILNKQIPTSTRVLPPGEYRLTLLQRLLDPQGGSRPLHEAKLNVTLK